MRASWKGLGAADICDDRLHLEPLVGRAVSGDCADGVFHRVKHDTQAIAAIRWAAAVADCTKLGGVGRWHLVDAFSGDTGDAVQCASVF